MHPPMTEPKKRQVWLYPQPQWDLLLCHHDGLFFIMFRTQVYASGFPGGPFQSVVSKLRSLTQTKTNSKPINTNIILPPRWTSVQSAASASPTSRRPWTRSTWTPTCRGVKTPSLLWSSELMRAGSTRFILAITSIWALVARWDGFCDIMLFLIVG